MADATTVATLVALLERQGLADTPGRLLYSGIGTLAPGQLYMLGYNPGGDPAAESDSARDHLLKLQSRSVYWNEYVDGQWRPGGRLCRPGEAPMQLRVRQLLRAIGLPVRTVCASNLILVRSRHAADLAGATGLADRCWTIHDYIIRLVRPKAILAIGGRKVFDGLASRGRLLASPQNIKAGHADWSCISAQLLLGTQVVRLVAVPHLARYAIASHASVMSWVARQLDLPGDSLAR